MMGVPAYIKIRAQFASQAAIAKIGAMKASLTPRTLMNEVGHELQGVVEEHIKSAGASSGMPWATMSAYRLKGRPQRQSSRHFYDPYQKELEHAVRFSVYGAGERGDVWLAAPWAQVHHYGSGRIPSRPLLPPRPIIDRVKKKVLDSFAKKVGLIGRRS